MTLLLLLTVGQVPPTHVDCGNGLFRQLTGTVNPNYDSHDDPTHPLGWAANRGDYKVGGWRYASGGVRIRAGLHGEGRVRIEYTAGNASGVWIGGIDRRTANPWAGIRCRSYSAGVDSPAVFN